MIKLANKLALYAIAEADAGMNKQAAALLVGSLASDKSGIGDKLKTGLLSELYSELYGLGGGAAGGALGFSPLLIKALRRSPAGAVVFPLASMLGAAGGLAGSIYGGVKGFKKAES